MDACEKDSTIEGIFINHNYTVEQLQEKVRM